jgi:hypothetical protein
VDGFEFLTIQAGGDYRLGPHFAVGPFASLSLARYQTITRESATSTRSVAISLQGNHEWLQFGARGTFGF